MSDEETLHTALKNSAEMKDEGNAFFMEKNWTSAITAYNQALACLPSHIPVVVTTTTNDEGDPQGSPNNSADATRINAPNRGTDSLEEEGSLNSSKQPVQSHKIRQLEEACSHARVVLNSNIAACELKLEAWEAAVKAATAALEEDPHHHKALWRRAKANEAIDSWSSLTSALKDYNTLIEIVPPSQPLYRDASSVLQSLEPRIEFARKRDTDKMLGQLKDVGNSVLGWFGMSTDNFKMTPNGEGGYSMSFVNNPSS